MRLLVPLAILLAATPALAQGPAAAPGPRAALRGDVTVSRDVVLLGDVVAVSGPAAEMHAFRAPPLGQTGTIQVARIAEAARAMGVAVDPGAVTQIVVTRASRRIAKADIEAAVRKALAARYALDNADVILGVEGNQTTVHVEPEASEELKVADLVYDARARRVEAVVTLPGSRTLALKPLRTAGQVVEIVEVPFLTRAVSRGDALREGDVRMERRPRAEFQALGFADPMALSGRVSKVNLAAGAVLRDADLARQELVEKNGVVTVVYEMPGIALSMRGKALEGGALGDVVQVQNVHSKRVLQATVTAPGTVSVSTLQPGRLADARPSSVTR